MTIDLNEVLPVVLYLALIILVIALTVLVIKLMKTLGKVDVILEDVNSKMKRADGLFDIIDKVTDFTSNVSDKIISKVTSAIHFVTKRRKRGKN